MADESVILNPGVGGAAIAVDTIGGISHELVKVEFGSDGTATQVDAAHPLPVTDAVAEAALASIAAEDFATSANQSTEIAALASILAKLSSDPASQTTLASILAKLIAAPSTEAKQDVGNSSLASIDTKLTNPLPVSGTVSTGGLTDTQLRATPVAVSGTVSVDTSLLATAAKQDTGNTSLASIDAGIPAALGQTTMAASMPVVIASNQSAIPVSFSGSATDNTIIYNSSLSVIGATTGLDTTGYSSVIIQVSGTWVGSFWIEGSNDNSVWGELMLISTDEFSLQDAINECGSYSLKTTTKYIRINVLQLQTGTIALLLLGRTVQGISGADLLSYAMDRTNNTPLYVEETSIRKDINRAIVPSDAPAPISGSGNVLNQVLAVIDTTGYQSITVQYFGTWVATVSHQVSNDLQTWAFVNGANILATAAGASQITSSNVYVFPVAGKYFRILITAFTSGIVQMNAYLRQQPVNTMLQPVNITFAGGAAAGNNTGTTGVLAVGGDATVGVTPTTRPLQIGGVDENAAVRRLLLDTSGRTRVSMTDQAGTSRALGAISSAANTYNVGSLAVTDVSLFEGQTFTELLGQLLIEMKINNQYLYELPLTLQRLLNDTTKSVGSFGNEPQEFRNDSSMFAA